MKPSGEPVCIVLDDEDGYGVLCPKDAPPALLEDVAAAVLKHCLMHGGKLTRVFQSLSEMSSAGESPIPVPLVVG